MSGIHWKVISEVKEVLRTAGREDLAQAIDPPMKNCPDCGGRGQHLVTRKNGGCYARCQTCNGKGRVLDTGGEDKAIWKSTPVCTECEDDPGTKSGDKVCARCKGVVV